MHNHFKMCLIILISSQKPLLLFSSKLPYTTNKKNISLNTIKIDDDITISSVFYEVILIFVRRRLLHPIYESRQDFSTEIGGSVGTFGENSKRVPQTTPFFALKLQ